MYTCIIEEGRRWKLGQINYTLLELVQVNENLAGISHITDMMLLCIYDWSLFFFFFFSFKEERTQPPLYIDICYIFSTFLYIVMSWSSTLKLYIYVGLARPLRPAGTIL